MPDSRVKADNVEPLGGALMLLSGVLDQASSLTCTARIDGENAPLGPAVPNRLGDRPVGVAPVTAAVRPRAHSLTLSRPMLIDTATSATMARTIWTPEIRGDEWRAGVLDEGQKFHRQRAVAEAVREDRHRQVVEAFHEGEDRPCEGWPA